MDDHIFADRVATIIHPRIMKKLLLIGSAAVALACSAHSQDADMDHHPFQIGAINYFGYGGLPLDKVRSALPLHVGDTLTFATFSDKPIREAVLAAIGKPPTDINEVCCNESGKLWIYIGLPGSTSRPVSTRKPPSGTARLDDRGIQLYDQEMAALEQAVTSNSAGEDDSQGYMVSNDPKLKEINLAMRAYAIRRLAELENVLRSAGDPAQRRAAAALLGYARRSQAQVDALAEAVNDPDDEVRNNAIRALEVFFDAPGSDRYRIDVQPMINLLYSGIWTDRNKASFFLLRMTGARDPQMLHSLKSDALGPLIEGASWTRDLGHASPFLTILGRIGSIPENKLNEMVDKYDANDIISAATSSPD